VSHHAERREKGREMKGEKDRMYMGVRISEFAHFGLSDVAQ